MIIIVIAVTWFCNAKKLFLASRKKSNLPELVVWGWGSEVIWANVFSWEVFFYPLWFWIKLSVKKLMSWVGKSFHSKLSLDKWKFGLYKGATQYSTNIFNFLCVFSESSQQIHSKLRYWVFTTIGDEKNTFLEISKVFTNKFPATCPSGHRWWPGGCLSKDIQKLQISSKLSGKWSRFWFAIYRMSASLQWEHFSTTLCWPWGVSSDESTNTAGGHFCNYIF